MSFETVDWLINSFILTHEMYVNRDILLDLNTPLVVFFRGGSTLL